MIAAGFTSPSLPRPTLTLPHKGGGDKTAEGRVFTSPLEGEVAAQRRVGGDAPPHPNPPPQGGREQIPGRFAGGDR